MAKSIAELWWWMLGLGVAVFGIFAVVLGLALFRRRPDPEETGEPGRPATEGRWIVWGGVVMPVAVLVVVLGLTVESMRAAPGSIPPGALVVEVVGHQWWYEVRYPGRGVETANEMHIPVGRPVALKLRSSDVIHSFWVPPLGGKMDMLPERTNTLILQADEPGRHLSRCAEFCGLQHTKMAMVVVAEPAGRFEAWLGDQRLPAKAPVDPMAARGRRIFTGADCASCHAVKGTTAGGTAGPDLTHLATRSTLAAGTVSNTPDQLRRWISDPHEIKRGVKMPGADLSDQDREALLAYLATLR